jgi:hypothetical protein
LSKKIIVLDTFFGNFELQRDFVPKMFLLTSFPSNKFYYFSHVKKKRGKIGEVNGFIMEKHMGDITINFD